MSLKMAQISLHSLRVVQTSNNIELRLRQSADVIAHCPLVFKFCTFEGESNDSYVCIL